MASLEGNRKIWEKTKKSPKMRKKFSNSLLAGKLEAAMNPSKIKLARLEKNLSQSQVAEKLGMSQASFASIESKNRQVKKDRAEKLAKLLKKNIEDLFKKQKNVDRYIAI